MTLEEGAETLVWMRNLKGVDRGQLQKELRKLSAPRSVLPCPRNLEGLGQQPPGLNSSQW